MTGDTTCGTTHHTGCPCHEARRDEEVARLEALLVDSQSTERDLRRQLAETYTLAEERLAHANQLQADIEAEQRGRLAIRTRHGARYDETMGAFIERLAVTADTQSRVKSAWEQLYNERNKLWREACDVIDSVRVVLCENGCDCECGHHHEEHDDDCELCLACRVGTIIELREAFVVFDEEVEG